ncbi:MAG: V-type ATP synthase subunit E [Candidatus Methanofastidiosum methylothiophilum]|uniref:V-type ATP synthase subunit E n=1 Tax=Candidatus Methanofastidiosum methylothiophilum TaxID=1705564 RepID=A0A150IS14_9EURY|nr:MAG: V-type ATP synthase subunit E [Candidatus Methanofastidiosum methylthiophilus]KYC47702.1 MAG: V-type ATP synthase subunit E [Candidatus Methanofastidiosum methylthiophilus]KYC50292.1 MAG: V-type ATP synthase subunit E [Candidatus Methanofastidiosum methylthiophilus]
MGKSTVADKVIEDAKKIAKDYEDQLVEKKKSKLKDIDITIDKLKIKKQESLKEKISLLARTETSRTNLEIKRKRLKMEQDVLEEIFTTAKTKLTQIDPEKNERILKKLVFVAELENIFSNEKDEKYVKKLVGARYKGNINTLGGISTGDSSGKIKEDFTFEAILDYVFENNLKEVRDILFGEAEYGFKCSLL